MRLPGHRGDGSVLVVAKPPRPGEAKTRLAVAVGAHAAADLAAAALLDTLDAAAAAFPAGRRVLALTGGLAGSCREAELLEAVQGWVVVAQRGATFAERLADAHRQAHRVARGPVAQIGMDTPHVDPALLGSLPELAERAGRPVLGAAEDGGWWVLVTTAAHEADALTGVPTSRADTGRLTAAALTAAGLPPLATVTMRDVDVPDDAAAVAALAPHTRFGRTWRGVDTGGLPARPQHDRASRLGPDVRGARVVRPDRLARHPGHADDAARPGADDAPPLVVRRAR